MENAAGFFSYILTIYGGALNFAGKFATGGLEQLSGAQVDLESALHRGLGDSITVPDAHLLFSGDFKRSGSDLIISDDHQRVTVPDYFLGSKRPMRPSMARR